MADLIFKELSYKLVGLAFKVDDTLGFGHSEKTYALAYEELLKESKLTYKKEVCYPIKFGEKIITKKYFDFLIENKIVIELKVGRYQYKQVFNQLFQYLKTSNLKLGLIIRFNREGVEIKRVLNIR